jgi:hypothetical protein
MSRFPLAVLGVLFVYLSFGIHKEGSENSERRDYFFYSVIA